MHVKCVRVKYNVRGRTLSNPSTCGKVHALVSVGVRTCARHLERVRVGAIVPVPANTVHGAFAGGAAVDGTLQAGLISLSRLEKAGRTG